MTTSLGEKSPSFSTFIPSNVETSLRNRFPASNPQDQPLPSRERRKSKTLKLSLFQRIRRFIFHQILPKVFDETPQGRRAMVFWLYLCVGPPFALALIYDLGIFGRPLVILTVILLIVSGGIVTLALPQSNFSLVYAVGISPILCCGLAAVSVSRLPSTPLLSPRDNNNGMAFAVVALAPVAWACTLTGGGSSSTIGAWLTDMFVQFFMLDVAHRGWSNAGADYFLVAIIHGLVAWVVGGISFRLRQANVQALQASRAKSRFLATISHELRTPMNAVLGMTDLALREMADGAIPFPSKSTPGGTISTPAAGSNSLIQDYLTEAQSAAKSLLALLDDVLDLSRVEAGKMKVETVPFDIEKCVVEGVRHLLTGGVTIRHMNQIKSMNSSSKSDITMDPGIDCAIFIDPILHEVRVGDPLRVRQIVSNLVANSVKFTKPPGVITVTVEPVHSGFDEDDILLTVTDTGIGISPEKLPLIFAPFVQADDSTTRKYGGSGLGLAITSELAALMNGKCWATSKVGEGSQFHVQLKIPPLSTDVTEESIDGKNAKVLIAFPHHQVLGIHMKYLEKFGFQVDTANDFKGFAQLLAQDRGLLDGTTGKRDYVFCLMDDVILAKPLTEELKRFEAGSPSQDSVPFASEKRFNIFSLMRHCPPVIVTTTPTNRTSLRSLTTAVFAHHGFKSYYGKMMDARAKYPPEDPRSVFGRKIHYIYKPSGPTEYRSIIKTVMNANFTPLVTPALSVSHWLQDQRHEGDWLGNQAKESLNLPSNFNLEFPNHRRVKSAPKEMTKSPEPVVEATPVTITHSFSPSLLPDSNSVSQVSSDMSSLSIDSDPSKTSSPQPTKPSRGKRLRVLLVEDNPLNTRVATKMLQKMGHTVLHAENGLECLEKLNIPLSLAVEAGIHVDETDLDKQKDGPYRENVDCILLDVMMPKCDGLQTAKIIRSFEKTMCHTKTPSSPNSLASPNSPMGDAPMFSPAIDYFNVKRPGVQNPTTPSISPSLITNYSASPVMKVSENFVESQLHVPIVGLTANAMSGDDTECLTAGMDFYLSKPVEMARLAEVLTQIAG